VVGGVAALIVVSIIIFFAVRRARSNRDENSQPQYQYEEESTDHWKTPPVSPTYDPSISTGPTVVSKGPSHPYVSVSLMSLGGVVMED